MFFAEITILALLIQSDPTPPPATQNPSVSISEPALLKVKRIYVDSFGDDETSKEVQSMIVSALVKTNQFKITENRDRADAILKGVALEKTAQELHAYSEGTAVAGRGGGAAIKDSSANTETTHEAKVAIRLVDSEGDVIWTSTQESKGGKYESATADAADHCVRQLVRDVEKLKNPNTSTPIKPPSNTSGK